LASRARLAGLALVICALLLGGPWPAGTGAAASALGDAPVPFEVWRFDAETGKTRSLGYPASRTAWGLAEFAPAADMSVTGVALWTTDAAVVDVYLYNGFDGTTPGERLAAKLDSTFDAAGYHSVSLDAPVATPASSPVVAVVKVTNASRGHPLLLDPEERGDRLRTFASPSGESGSWYDVGAHGHGALAITLDALPAEPTEPEAPAAPAAPAAAGRGQAYRLFVPMVANEYALVTTGWTVILQEDFEGELSGEWALSDEDPADGSYILGQRSCRAYSGSQSGWFVGGGAGAALGCQSAYPRRVASWMVYGPFDLAGASDAELAFQLWLNSEPEYDGFFAGASIDGTDYHGYMVTGNSSGWMPYRLNLRAVPELGDIAGNEEIWIALLFVSDGVVMTQEGAYIDDIVLRRFVGTPADLPEEVAPVPGGKAQRVEATFSLRR
jgi:hypothetical protein